MSRIALAAIALGFVACFTHDDAVGPIDSGLPKLDATTGDASIAADAGDASTMADTSSDVVMDTSTPACNLANPFGTPTLVDYPLTLDDYSARLSADLLSM